MKIAALSNKSPWAPRALRDADLEVSELEGVEMEALVTLDSVEILHHGSDRNYRPYLHLTGAVGGLVPVEPLAFGIEELTYSEASKPSFDAFMEFTDEDLSELALKGAWNEGFAVPELLLSEEWQLPNTVNLTIVSPSSVDQPPVVFVEIISQNQNEYDESVPEKASGYGNLAQYFPNKEVEVTFVPDAERTAPSRSDKFQDLFAGIEFETKPSGFEFDGLTPAERQAQELAAEEELARTQAVRTGLVPRGVFERLFNEHEAVMPTITYVPEPEPEPAPEGDAAVYIDDVQPKVDERMAEPSSSHDEIKRRGRYAAETVEQLEGYTPVAEIEIDDSVDLDVNEGSPTGSDGLLMLGDEGAYVPSSSADELLPPIVAPAFPGGDSAELFGSRRKLRESRQHGLVEGHSEDIDSKDEDLLRKAGEQPGAEPEIG